ncbi:MAG TPA: hypothetical protein VFK57_21720 [Vicinamibacterales bacterium]|nr:hypothetical protein [Vicinamibacterales bacterium]
MSRRLAFAAGWVAVFATAGFQSPYAGNAATPGPNVTITITSLKSFGRGAEAMAVNDAGTIIAGHAWDRQGLLHAVRWTLQNDGSWAFTPLLRPAGATSAIARGVNARGDVAGNDFPASTSRALLWPHPQSQATPLGCATDLGAVAVYGISGAAQTVVGTLRGGTAASWTPGHCREDLPPLVAGGFATAIAVSGDGTIIGGASSVAQGYVPVRWTKVAAEWIVEQLDARAGIVYGANSGGDLAGVVDVLPCASSTGCQRATVWSAGGTPPLDLGTLGGEDSWARDINGSGEVVGGSTSSRGTNTGYFWSASTGMLALPFKGRWAAANALSDVRPDGTRVAVGMDSGGTPVVWIVRVGDGT